LFPAPGVPEEHVIQGLELATISVQHSVEGLARVRGLAHADACDARLSDLDVVIAVPGDNTHVKPSHESVVDIRLA
jgi:hypothetical protein